LARFDDKRVLISGGASGIGLAAARLFREEGAAVAVADIDPQRLESATPAGVVAIEGDVASMADGERIVASAVEALGGIDVLICNAGIPSRSPILDLTEEEFDRVLGVNLKGMFTLIKATAPLMVEQGGGTIVTVGSELSFVADPETPAYNASKGAVVMFTKSIALDLIRHGIRVNAMCPGTTWTPLIEQELDTSPDPAALQADLDSWGPIGRVARPEEQARGILFLASDESSYAVGTTLVVDGGFTAR
jgi:NAD(P)-dependent dehydrogenase (short-subunit alcohol dehydrogenase family)